MNTTGKVTAVLLLVILVMGGIVAYTYVNAQGELSSQSSTIQSQSSLLQGQALTIQSQSSALSKSSSSVTALEANVTATAELIRADDAMVSTLTSTISTDNATITSLESGYSTANATIASLEKSAAPLQAQVASLQSQVTTLTTQVSGLKTQLASLQAQVTQLTAITSLSETSIRISQQLVQVPGLGDEVAASFQANYSGYVSVAMSSISNIAAIQVGAIIVFGPSVISGQYPSEPIGPYSYTTIPDMLVFPITPGSVSIYISNSANISENATLTVTYYY